MCRIAYALGGLGSGVAKNKKQEQSESKSGSEEKEDNSEGRTNSGEEDCDNKEPSSGGKGEQKKEEKYWGRPLDCPKCGSKKSFREGYCDKCRYDVE